MAERFRSLAGAVVVDVFYGSLLIAPGEEAGYGAPTSISTLPTTPPSTAVCASAVRSSG